MVFYTRKHKSCLPSLKSSSDKDLKSHVVYELTCNGCKSIYVGQTYPHITTCNAEHATADSSMGVHAIECNVDKTAFQWKKLDQFKDNRGALYKNTETSHQHARRIPKTRIDIESLVWRRKSNLKARHVMKRKFQLYN